MDPTHKVLLSLSRVHLDERSLETARALGPLTGWRELFRLARRGGVAGMVSRHVARVEAPAPIRRAFHTLALRVQHRNQVMMQQARELCAGAETAGLVLIPLKGASLNMGLPYRDLGMRSMGDLDLLTRRDQLELMEAFLGDHGYRPTSDRGFSLRHSHHLRFSRIIARQEVTVELHWTPLKMALAGAAEDNRLIERATIHRYQGAGVRVLDPDDMMLVLVLHLIQHRFCEQLKWLVDIAELARTATLTSWERLWRQAAALGCHRAAARVVRMAGDLLDAPVPAPPGSPLLLPLLEAFSPDDGIITSTRPRGRLRQSLVIMLGYDSSWAGLRHLWFKGIEIIERTAGQRLPGVRSPRHPL